MSRRLRVVFVASGAGPLLFDEDAGGRFGGAELRALRTATALAHVRPDLIAVELVTPGPPQRSRTPDGLPVGALPPPGHPPTLAAFQQVKSAILRRDLSSVHARDAAQALRHLPTATLPYRLRPAPPRWEALEALRPDIVIAFGPTDATAAAVRSANRVGACSVVWLTHDQMLGVPLRPVARAHGPDGATGVYNRYAIRQADHVLAQTLHQTQLVAARFGRTAHHLPNLWIPSAPKGRAEGAQPYLAWVGRAEPVKRFDLLLALAEALPEVRFEAVCPGLDVSGDDLPPNVRVHGMLPVAVCEALIRDARGLVHTADAEGFPNVFLQAAAHGVPIVSLRVDPDGVLDAHQLGRCCEGDLDRLATLSADLASSDVPWGRGGARYVERVHAREPVIRSLCDLLELPGTSTKTSPLRICILSSVRKPQTMSSIAALAARGHRVTLLAEVAGDEPRPAIPEGAQLIALPSGEGGAPAQLETWRAAATAVARAEADVFHAHHGSGRLAWLAAALGKAPLVLGATGADADRGRHEPTSPAQDALTRSTYRAASLVLARTPHLAEAAERVAGTTLPTAPLRWVLDRERFRPTEAPDLRASLDIAEDAAVLFVPKALRPRLRTELVVEALAKLARRLDRVVLIVPAFSAAAESVARLRSTARALGVEGAVRELPAIAPERMPCFYTMADVAISMASADGLPNSVAEAIACGTPHVLADLPDFRGVLRDGVGVRLIPPTADALADAVHALVTDDAHRRAVLAAGEEVLKANPTPAAHAEAMEEHYRWAMARARGWSGPRPWMVAQLAAHFIADTNAGHATTARMRAAREALLGPFMTPTAARRPHD